MIPCNHKALCDIRCVVDVENVLNADAQTIVQLTKSVQNCQYAGMRFRLPALEGEKSRLNPGGTDAPSYILHFAISLQQSFGDKGFW
jgi:hypothetical protein